MLNITPTGHFIGCKCRFRGKRSNTIHTAERPVIRFHCFRFPDSTVFVKRASLPEFPFGIPAIKISLRRRRKMFHNEHVFVVFLAAASLLLDHYKEDVAVSWLSFADDSWTNALGMISSALVSLLQIHYHLLRIIESKIPRQTVRNPK